MYQGYVCQYKDVLKQYQLKYAEAPYSHEYYEKKREHEEIKNRVLACSEQLKVNENILMEFLGINIFIMYYFDYDIFIMKNVINQPKL